MSDSCPVYMVWQGARERYYKPVIQSVRLFGKLEDAKHAYASLSQQLTHCTHFRDAAKIMNVYSAEHLCFAASYHAELGDCYAGMLVVSVRPTTHTKH